MKTFPKYLFFLFDFLHQVLFIYHCCSYHFKHFFAYTSFPLFRRICKLGNRIKSLKYPDCVFGNGLVKQKKSQKSKKKYCFYFSDYYMYLNVDPGQSSKFQQTVQFERLKRELAETEASPLPSGSLSSAQTSNPGTSVPVKQLLVSRFCTKLDSISRIFNYRRSVLNIILAKETVYFESNLYKMKIPHKVSR